jgi:hypothetical protein
MKLVFASVPVTLPTSVPASNLTAPVPSAVAFPIASVPDVSVVSPV